MHHAILEELARETVNGDPDWRVYRWEAIQAAGQTTPLGWTLTGAVTPLVTRGPRKGQPNWAKYKKSTDRTVTISRDTYEAYEAKWVERTGLCPVCVGKGDRIRGWSRESGTKTEPCGACNGTGKSAIVVAH